MLGQMTLEARGVERFGAHRLALAGDIEVDQRQLNLLQPPSPAQQRAVDPELRPVYGAMALRYPPHIAAMRLEFLQAIGRAVVTVRASPHAQLTVFALERDLRFIPRSAASGDRCMAFDALAGARSRRETQIQIPGFGREFAQRAHGDGVLHAPAHATLQTATSMPAAAHRLSQRS